MKKCMFLLIALLKVPIIGCPFEFSHEDQRPFFEQYESDVKQENTPTHNNSHKENNS